MLDVNIMALNLIKELRRLERDVETALAATLSVQGGRPQWALARDRKVLDKASATLATFTAAKTAGGDVLSAWVEAREAEASQKWEAKKKVRRSKKAQARVVAATFGRESAHKADVLTLRAFAASKGAEASVGPLLAKGAEASLAKALEAAKIWHTSCLEEAATVAKAAVVEEGILALAALLG